MRFFLVIGLCLAKLVYADSVVTTGNISVTSSSYFKGAISSVKYKGIELINSADRGRLLQSAVSFDGMGECLNPTEGGSASHWTIADALHREDTSVLLSTAAYKKNIWTVSQMGYWLNPTEMAFSGCGIAINLTYASRTILAKHITVNSNLIIHDIIFNVGEAHASGTFEALTGYIPSGTMPNRLFYDPATGSSIIPSSNFIGEQEFPIIYYNNSGTIAIGVFSPALPQNWNGALVGYGSFNFQFERVNKFNCVFRDNNITAKQYAYQCITVIGTLPEVKITLNTLHNLYK